MRSMAKRIEVYRANAYLVIQLKRFKHTSFSRRKLNNLVTFSETLQLELSREREPGPPIDLSMYEFLGGKVLSREDGGEECRARQTSGPALRCSQVSEFPRPLA